jgi:Ca-activated chloride channel homolog
MLLEEYKAMIQRGFLRAFLLLLFSHHVVAQAGGGITLRGSSPSSQMTTESWAIYSATNPLQDHDSSLSKLDLKAPRKARRAFDKGYQLLMRKDRQGAVAQFITAISIYPSYVSAHNALGTAYFGLGQNDQAHAEFSQAISLDDRLPNSYLNLGYAELALQHFSAAEQSIQKASSLAPLDLTVLTTLAYVQLRNNNYEAAVATAHQVHERKHEGVALVHLYAAAALEAQRNFLQAQQELKFFLKEDPKSAAAASALQMMRELDDEARQPPAQASELKVSFVTAPSEAPAGPDQLPRNIRKFMQASNESKQIAEAEAAAGCPTCETAEASAPAQPPPSSSAPPYPKIPDADHDGYILRASTDEVAVFFTATDRRKPVTTLTGQDVGILDNHKAPAAIIGFRTEADLPLRLGIVVDTSSSVSGRFKFEQNSATDFLQKVVTGEHDLAFVIGVANSVLLAQDFTGDQKLLAHAIDELAPSGGTALWDAVTFAADKLAKRAESQPVARILVVISDGEDNSSDATLKQAIYRAQLGEVAVYSVSTLEMADSPDAASLVGEHALTTLAELSGGAAFTPGSIDRLRGSLADLQQIIRSRYLVSYKPASFKRDGRYRAISITAAKDGHKLRVHARKGYFASAAATGSRNN